MHVHPGYGSLIITERICVGGWKCLGMVCLPLVRSLELGVLNESSLLNVLRVILVMVFDCSFKGV